jgi:hypothetical protein
LAKAAVEQFPQALQAPLRGTLDEEIEIRRLVAIQLAAIKGDGAQDVIATLEECLALAQGDTIDHFDTF